MKPVSGWKWFIAPFFILSLAVAFHLDLGSDRPSTGSPEAMDPDGLPVCQEDADGGLSGNAPSRGGDSARSIPESIDFPGRLRELTQVHTSPDDAEVGRVLLLREWAEMDPVSMTAWVVEHLSGGERMMALKQAAVIWAGNDLESALGWVERLSDAEQRNAMLVEVGFEASRLHPERVVDFALGMPPSTSRDRLVVHAARQWATLDAVASGNWASGLPESRLREEVLSAIAVSVSSVDGRYAAGLVAGAMVGGKDQVDASILVARKWGGQNPVEAAEWIARFPDVSVRRHALEGLVGVWSSRSHATMLAWVESVSDTRFRGEALDAIQSLKSRPNGTTENPSP